MDFSYSEEQQMLQDSVQKFVHNQYDFETRKGVLKSAQGFSEKNWQLFAELGWLTVPFKEEDGGFGGSAVDLMVMMEEFGKGMVVEPFLPTAVIAGGLISVLGNQQQKDELITGIMEGKLQLACAYTEAGSRYNLANVATTARKDGDKYVIDGEKILVLNGPAADKILVVTRTSGSNLDNEGISIFVVAADTAGIKRTAYSAVDGHRAAEIKFDSVSVPGSQLLGAEGKALPALQNTIDRATLAVCAEAVGAMGMLLSKTVEYSKTRKQFGTAIGTFQALQHRMADMFVECELAKSIVIMAAMKLDGNDSAADKARSVSAAKSKVGRAMRKVGQEAVQLHGGIAVTDELDVGHYFKRVTTIEHLFGNTDFHTMRFASIRE